MNPARREDWHLLRQFLGLTGGRGFKRKTKKTNKLRKKEYENTE
jgi:hypothetical protein